MTVSDSVHRGRTLDASGPAQCQYLVQIFYFSHQSLGVRYSVRLKYNKLILVCIITNYGSAPGCTLEAPSPPVRHRLGLACRAPQP